MGTKPIKKSIDKKNSQAHVLGSRNIGRLAPFTSVCTGANPKPNKTDKTELT